MKEPVVVDSTCLIALERIGQLDLLPALFEPVFIPPKVQEEFGVSLSWLNIQAPTNTALVAVLSALVDEGEAEAISLAKERGCLLILDDRKARRWARYLGVRLIGTVGIFVRAKKQGLISAVKPLLEALKRSGFYLNQALEDEVLRLAGEA